MDSWNDINGIDVTQDQYEEKHVEEMKAVQEEGDKRRAVIKEGFMTEDGKLSDLDKELLELGKRIEATAQEAEKATKFDQAQTSKEGVAVGEKKNPFSEYKDQIKVLEGKSAGKEAASVLQVDDSGARSRMERLKAESELLKKCLKEGKKGNFSSYSTSVAGK